MTIPAYISTGLLACVIAALGLGLLRSLWIVLAMVRAIRRGETTWPGPPVKSQPKGLTHRYLYLYSQYAKSLYWVFIALTASVFVLTNWHLGLLVFKSDWFFLAYAVVLVVTAFVVGGRASSLGNKVQALCPIPGQSPLTTYLRALDLMDNKDDHPYASKMLLSVVHADPSFFRAYTDLAMIAGRADAPELAEEYARKAVAVAPEHGPGHYYLGCALEDMGRLSEALECFKTALACPSVNQTADRRKFQENPRFRQMCQEGVARLAGRVK